MACVNISELENRPNIARKIPYICISCKVGRLDDIVEATRKQHEWQTRYRELKGQHQELLRILAEANHPMRTYAEQTASNIPSQNTSAIQHKGKVIQNQGENVLILKPKASKNKITEISKTVIPKTLSKVNVVKARTTKQGAAVITFPTKKAMEMAESQLQKHNDIYLCDKPKKILPKMTLLGVPKHLDNENLKTEILNQNENINNLVTKKNLEFNILFSYKKTAKTNQNSDESSNVVVKMHPDIWKDITNSGSFIYLPMMRVKAIDRYHIIHCFHCQNSVINPKNVQTVIQILAAENAVRDTY